MTSLAEYERLLINAPHCRTLLHAWLNWRGDNPLPSTDSVLAEDLGSALGNVTVFEAHAPERVIFRLVAAWHEMLTDRDLKGENFVDMASPEHRPLRIQRFWNIATTPCGSIGDVTITRRSGLPTPFKSLMLPVSPGTPGKPMRIYTAIDEYGEPASLGDMALDPAPLSQRITYIDIGFGTPEDGAGTEDVA